MPDAAKEVQVNPSIPTRTPGGWPRLDTVPVPSPGQEKATTRYKYRSATRSLPALVKLSPKEQGQPHTAAFPLPAHPDPGAEGDAGAGSRQEQGMEAAREALP